MAGDKHKYDGQEDTREGSIVLLAHLKPKENNQLAKQYIMIQSKGRIDTKLIYPSNLALLQ